MEIFGVPVYLNSLSVACFLPVLLSLTSAIYVLTLKRKTRNTWLFFFLLVALGVFAAGYAFGTSVFHPVGAYHRWATILGIVLTLSFYSLFLMTYSEETHRRIREWIFLCIIGPGLITGAYFKVRSLASPSIFRRSGLFWDFDMDRESLAVGAFILASGILTLIFAIVKYRRMLNRHNARTFLYMIVIMNLYLLPAASLNPLARKGIVSYDSFIWIQAVGTTLAFLIIYVIFLSHTDERATVAGNLTGVTLATVLTLITSLGYPLIEDRKASFREIWAAKIQAESAAAADKNVVLLTPLPPLHDMERGAKTQSIQTNPTAFIRLSTLWRGGREVRPAYFRDGADYYRKALQQIPSDGVILRADAKGGVYTFPVELVENADFTRNSGNTSAITTKSTKWIVGIELIELRKYIHPTAAKLVLAQFVIILLIVVVFPLFFRGILIRPMYRLLDGVIAISRGRYGHRIENQRSDELGVISRHFDKMAVTIEAATTRLEETVAQRTAQLTEEKKKSDTLLLNILPVSIADELKEKGHAQPVRIDSATVLFTDFVGFTKISESLTPEEVVAELDKCFSYFDQVTEKYGLEKLKTIGDSFMCAGGVPEANRTHAIDACLAALEIQAFMNQMKEIKHQQGFPYWELRLGINTGPLVAGVVGHKKFAYDVWGDTVNTASRMESSGLAGAINISRSTYELVQKWFVCEHRGQVSAKNKGEIDMYLLTRIRPEYCVDQEGRVPSEKMRREYVGIRRDK